MAALSNEFVDLNDKISTALRSEEPSECGLQVDAISKGLIGHKYKLINVIEVLGPYLTHEDKEQRKNGTLLLSAILHRLPVDHITEKEASHLSEFFTGRLNDHHSVIPAVLSGLCALSTFTNLSNENAGHIARAIFQDVQTQSMVQLDRKMVLQIFYNFVNSKLTAMQALGQDLVFGYIQVVDGEKDPRNLLLAFTTVPRIVQHFKIDTFAEELFEVTACYFPIDFNPPPGDKFGVSRAELISSLRACMAASPLFAEFCLPLVLEKLNSDVDSSKLAALETLAACAEVYGARGLSEFVNSLWGSLSREVLMSSSGEFEGAALEALCAMVRALEGGDDLSELCRIVIKDCARHLYEPDMKLMLTCGKLLTAVCVGSEFAARIIYKETVKIVMEQFNKTCVIKSRCQILDVMIGYAEAGSRYIASGESHPLHEYVDDICVLFLSLASDYATSLRCRSLRGSCAMMPYPHSRHANIIESALMLAVTDPSADVRKEANSSLELLSRDHTQSLIDALLEKILQHIKTARNVDTMETNMTSALQETSTREQLTSVMAVVLSISAAQRRVAELVLPEVVHRLGREINENQEGHVRTIISTLVSISGTSRTDKVYDEFAFQSVVRPLVTMVMTSSAEHYDVIDPVLANVGRIALATMSGLETSSTSLFANQMIDTFLRGTWDQTELLTVRNFKPLEASSPTDQTRLLSILCAVVSSLKEIPEDAILRQSLESLALTSSDHVTRKTACKFLAQIVNRMEKDDKLTAYLDEMTSRLRSKMADSHVIRLWAWLGKALLARGHPGYKVFLDEIALRLSTDQGSEFAHAYHVILSRDDDVMNELTHSNVRLMYRQRLFLETLPKLVEGFNKAEKDRKSHYLTVLSHLLSNVPKQVVLAELPPLLPMLVQSLQSDSVSLWLSTLDAVANLLTEARELMTSYTDSLIVQFLRLAQYEDDMKVRMAALRCLSTSSSLPTHLLLPHQKVVLKNLQTLLDDRKRLVRREAVKTRCDWFLVGSAG